MFCQAQRSAMSNKARFSLYQHCFSISFDSTGEGKASLRGTITQPSHGFNPRSGILKVAKMVPRVTLIAASSHGLARDKSPPGIILEPL
ncbi:hypothetical protein PoB_003546200 [Plakobranchus ocellatus]|uniref:Uncharacterized protein n=1 Tax=Plakobranchus ocellatus TaxID=259542 RepID=A0AAV4APU3_9GAST|nr:hypothetical protein PoB_003546200 [Plakobranchus ocellatus]